MKFLPKNSYKFFSISIFCSLFFLSFAFAETAYEQEDFLSPQKQAGEKAQLPVVYEQEDFLSSQKQAGEKVQLPVVYEQDDFFLEKEQVGEDTETAQLMHEQNGIKIGLMRKRIAEERKVEAARQKEKEKAVKLLIMEAEENFKKKEHESALQNLQAVLVQEPLNVKAHQLKREIVERKEKQEQQDVLAKAKKREEQLRLQKIKEEREKKRQIKAAVEAQRLEEEARKKREIEEKREQEWQKEQEEKKRELAAEKARIAGQQELEKARQAKEAAQAKSKEEKAAKQMLKEKNKKEEQEEKKRQALAAEKARIERQQELEKARQAQEAAQAKSKEEKAAKKQAFKKQQEQEGRNKREIKALLKIAKNAYGGKDYEGALKALFTIFTKDPLNKTAQDLKKKIVRKQEEQKIALVTEKERIAPQQEIEEVRRVEETASAQRLEEERAEKKAPQEEKNRRVLTAEKERIAKQQEIETARQAETDARAKRKEDKAAKKVLEDKKKEEKQQRREITRLLKRAEKAYEERKYQDALEVLNVVFVQDPQNQKAKELKESIVTIQETEKDVPEEQHVKMLLQEKIERVKKSEEHQEVKPLVEKTVDDKELIATQEREKRREEEIKALLMRAQKFREKIGTAEKGISAPKELTVKEKEIKDVVDEKVPTDLQKKKREQEEVEAQKGKIVEQMKAEEARAVEKTAKTEPVDDATKKVLRKKNIEILLNKAKKNYKKGDCDAALKNLLSVFAQAPLNKDARELKKKIKEKQMKKKGIREQKKKITKPKTTKTLKKKDIEGFLGKAKKNYKKVDYDTALKNLEFIFAKDPSNIKAQALQEEIIKKQTRARHAEKLPELPDKITQTPVIKKTSKKTKDAQEAVGVENQIEQVMKKAQETFNKKEYDQALFYVNQALIWNPQYEEGIDFKHKILKARRRLYEDQYEKKRKRKADSFREHQYEKATTFSEEDLQEIKESESIHMRQEKERLGKEKRRQQIAEDQMREDSKKKTEIEEKEYLEKIIKEVEESGFYEKFKVHEKQKREKETLRERQIHTFLLRAEGLTEMGHYEEAAVYLNNVFMVEPYNERAQKMRKELEGKFIRQRTKEKQILDTLFEQEKKEFKKIRKKVHAEKVDELMRQAKKFYDKKDWLNARQWAQKILIINPSNGRAKYFIRKVDKQLIKLQEELKASEEAQAERKTGAMEEAFQEAARALEVELVEDKKDDIGIKQRVQSFLIQADKKIRVHKDYDGALVDLNRAFALDSRNEIIMKKIKEVRELKTQQRAAAKKGAGEEPISDDVERKGIVSISGVQTKEDVSSAKERRWEEYNHGKRILKSAAEKNYQNKVDQSIKKAQLYLENNKIEKAKGEIERIFFFDPKNPTAKDLLQRITEHEVMYRKRNQKEATDEAFEHGLELEKLKVALGEKGIGKDVVRSSKEAKIEDRKAQEKAIKKLLKEGKALFKERQYYEAINKFEAIFMIDVQHEDASKCIDQVKETMLRERETERKKIKEDQKREINDKLTRYSKEIRSLHAQGRYTEAAISIEKGLILDPSNKYLKELKKLNEKGYKEQLKRELTPDEEIQNLINAGIKEYIQGNYSKAKEYFERVLEIDPHDKRAKNSIKKIEEKLSGLYGNK
ncbi:MAG: hypothetical protein KKH94_13420 [Candidatus Omnitrophica bacterium]|nr:hypothetical protein [Candidatus Omnitrophota bacterium]